MTGTPRLERIQLSHRDLSRASRQRDEGVAGWQAAEWELGSFDLFSESLGFAPSFEELLDTYLQNFTGRNIPKSRPVRAVNVHVVLTPEQLEEGAHLPISAPVFRICRCCGGSGSAGYSICEPCLGQGFSEEIRSAEVLIPAHSAQGQVIPLSLRHLGISNLYLNIHVSLGA